MIPNSAEIIASLERISNEQLMLAMLYHMLIFGIIIALFNGWRPFNKVFGSLLSLLVLSVSVIAFWYGNPFNGSIFLAFFMLLLLFSIKSPGRKIELSKGWLLIPAVILLIFGWIYPHFLGHNEYTYLVAAPLGLIPCPTLSLLIGFTLLFNGLGSKKWSITLAALGLFYGIFGVWKLNIFIDSFLAVGSLILLYQGIKLKEEIEIDQKSMTLTFN